MARDMIIPSDIRSILFDDTSLTLEEQFERIDLYITRIFYDSADVLSSDGYDTLLLLESHKLRLVGIREVLNQAIDK